MYSCCMQTWHQLAWEKRSKSKSVREMISLHTVEAWHDSMPRNPLNRTVQGNFISMLSTDRFRWQSCFKNSNWNWCCVSFWICHVSFSSFFFFSPLYCQDVHVRLDACAATILLIKVRQRHIQGSGVSTNRTQDQKQNIKQGANDLAEVVTHEIV